MGQQSLQPVKAPNSHLHTFLKRQLLQFIPDFADCLGIKTNYGEEPCYPTHKCLWMDDFREKGKKHLMDALQQIVEVRLDLSVSFLI